MEEKWERHYPKSREVLKKTEAVRGKAGDGA